MASFKKQRGGKGVNMSLAFFDSHMPRHLFSDEHEWISDSNGPYSSTSGTKANGTGLGQPSGKGSCVELHSSLTA